MKVYVCKDSSSLGERAAGHAAARLREAIEKRGRARLLLSTGASQFTTLEALTAEALDWSAVEVFHLDEYIGLPATHPASFIRYLNERFIARLPSLGAMHFVQTHEDIPAMIKQLTSLLNEAAIDVGLIGIGENAHLAFNDPPADFDDPNAYKIVTLDDACRNQQLGEGWFSTIDDVPKQAVSMTISQILKCKTIISAVPFKVKAKAIADTLHASEITNIIPATALKRHADATLYLDPDSASLLDAHEYA